MKKILLALIIVFSSISCNKKTENQGKVKLNENDSLFSSVIYNNKTVNLGYKFIPNSHFNYQLTSTISTDELIKTDTLIKNRYFQTADYTFNFIVKSKNPDSTYSLNTTISKIKIVSKYNDQVVNFSSDSTISPGDRNKFIEYETVLNTPFELVLTKKGLIKEINNIDKMVDKFIAAENQTEKITKEDRQKIIDYIKYSALAPLCQLIFRIMPENKITKDSTWEEKYRSTMASLTILNKVTFKLDDFVKLPNGVGAKITASLSTTNYGNKKGTEQGINYEFDEPKFNGDGVIIFDIDKGMLFSSVTSTKLETKVRMEGKDSQQKNRKTERSEISTTKNVIKLL
ncbi:DUF6263 family protein [Melioribacteraceae bacterium 4301-Me]|uniref:DUF6263 family protein n=1 Tax=Pyranulibacter aquaticus TaxID=3163344 RepID=UPI003596399E